MNNPNINYIPRDISWLSFNGRVLQEASDKSNPLLERLKFLGIFSNNLDEFFRVRVATINRLINEDKRAEINRIPAIKVLNKINKIVAKQQKIFLQIYSEILSELEQYNIKIINEKQLNKTQQIFIKKYYYETLRRHLFPIILKNLDDTLQLRDKMPYLAIRMYNTEKKKKENYALIEIPELVPRFLILPERNNTKYVILIDDVIRFCLSDIFSLFGYQHYEAYTIKFTRDAELDIEDDVSKSFMERILESLKKRRTGRPTRFIYDDSIPNSFLKLMIKSLKISKRGTMLPGGRYHNFRDFMNFPELEPLKIRNILKPQPHPLFQNTSRILPLIKKQDIMLHFPYQSFDYIIDLLREASIDPKVVSIKMTIYRVARNSNVMNALINAARNGKKVTVFMELQARFDEQNNIYWTEKLHEEGVKVIQSRTGFKVHAKLILITRKEKDEYVNYANIGTGNFNEDTARIYCDDSLLTADPRITTEVSNLFDIIEYHYKSYKFKHLVVAPYNMRSFFQRSIATEIRNARKGLQAWAIIKLNNLVDEEISKKITEAIEAGVKITLIVRGACIIVPSKENIPHFEAFSIVDRFLEHSRIFVFCNAGNPSYFISSADWMIRNFDYRIEVACPVYDKSLQKEIMNMLEIQMKDNTKARILSDKKENIYKKTSEKRKCRSQYEIYKMFKSSQQVI